MDEKIVEEAFLEILKRMIQKGKIDGAIELLREVLNCADYLKAERYVFAAFYQGFPLEIKEVILQGFLDTHRKCNYRPAHGYWVRSLSSFITILWVYRMDKWIKEFYEVAFKGAIELDDPGCYRYLKYLVKNFFDFARCDDNPSDFHLTLKNLSWLKTCGHTLLFKAMKAWIKRGRFASEETLRRWRVKQYQNLVFTLF